MTRVPRAGRAPALLITALLAAPALAACSAGAPADELPPDPSAASGTPSPGVTGEASPLAVPDGVTPTEPGTRLSYGDEATVAWPLPGGGVGVLDLRVDAVREVPRQQFNGWLGGEALEQSRPYFADVRVTNSGETDLGARDVPLYLLDDNGTLGPPWTFDGTFEPCPSGPLPRTFAPGDRARTCLVFLAPQRARIDAMAFTRAADFEPVIWTGEVATPGDRTRRNDEKGPTRRKRR